MFLPPIRRLARALWPLTLFLLALTGLLGAAPARAQNIAFSQQPNSEYARQTINPPVVVRYTNNDPNAGFLPSSVTLTLSGGSGTLSGTQTAAFDSSSDTTRGQVNATYTFSDLSVTAPGTYTLTANADDGNGNQFAIPSGSFAVLPILLAGFNSQPTDTVSGQPINGAAGVTVHLSNNNSGNTGTAGATVTMTLGTFSGTGALSGTGTAGTGTTTQTTGTTDANGDLTFTGLTVDKKGTYNLTASVQDAGGNTASATSVQFAITPALGAAFGQQPTSTVSGQPITPPVTVIVTSNGSNQPAAGQSVTLTYNTVSGGGMQTLGGTTTQATVANSGSTTTATATFPDLSLPLVGAYTLTASVTDKGGNTVTTTSSRFAVTPSLTAAFTQAPTSTPSGAAITPPVTVRVTSNGSKQSAAGRTVTLALVNSSDERITLSGTTTGTTDTSGSLSFPGLSVSGPAGATYQFQATTTDNGGNTVTATTGTITVSPGAPATLTFTNQPRNAPLGLALNTGTATPGVMVQVSDAFGNLIPGQPITVALPSANVGKLTGTTTQTADGSGVATFRDLKVSPVGNGYSLMATAGGVSLLSSLFNVVPDPALIVTSAQDDGGFGTLRSVLGFAPAGGTVTFDTSPTGVFAPGNGTQTIALLGGEIDLVQTVTVTGPTNGVSVSGNYRFRVFGITGGPVSLSNLTVENGRTGGEGAPFFGGGGGLALSGAAVTLTNCVVNNNVPTGDGGGIYNGGGALTLTGCSVTSNGANGQLGDGGGIYSTGAVSLTGCLLSRNIAFNGGGLDNVGGTATLTACRITSNGIVNGSGVYNDFGALSLTDCVVAGNFAYNAGVGVYNVGGRATVTSCTFTGNQRNSGRIPGAVFNAGAGGTLTLTDDILYGDNGGEVVGPASVSFCDVQGNPGTPAAPDANGNFSADPQFASSNLDLSASSPVLGRGTVSAPNFRSADVNGDPFFNPPAIGAVEGPQDTHILWTNPDGRTIFWDVSRQGAFAIAGNYDPFQDPQGHGQFTARALSTGFDRVSHVLWNTPDGRTCLSAVTTAGVRTDAFYGPFSDDGTANTIWQAVGVSTDGNNVTHLLWDNPNGRTILWDVDPNTGAFTVKGNYAGFSDDGTAATAWKGVSLSSGPDGLSHVLFSSGSSNKALLWNLDAADDQPAGSGNASTASVYGPFSDDGSGNTIWQAKSVSVGQDNVPRLLWGNPDGRTILWSVNPSDGSFAITANYGGFSSPGAGGLPEAAVSLANGLDSLSHVLFVSADHTSLLWNLDSAQDQPSGSGSPSSASTSTSNTSVFAAYGPFSDDGTGNTFWQPIAVSAAQGVTGF